MKQSSLMFGILVVASMSQAEMGKVTSAMDYEGRVTNAVGLESKRDNQPCAITIQRHKDGSATFDFAIGDKADLHGTHTATKKTVFHDLSFDSAEQKLEDGSSRQEKITLDISGRHAEKIKLVRSIYQRTPGAFASGTLSNVECKATVKAADVDAPEADTAINEDEIRLDK